VSVPRKIVSGLLTAGLLALAMWLYTFKPHMQARAQTPITTSGRIGATVDNRDFSVKVDRVDVARSISKPSYPTPKIIRGLGLFVIVHLGIRSNQKPFQPGHVRLVTRGGVAYGESGRPAISTFGNSGYQAMLWGPATYIFEIPPDRLAGVRLVIGGSALLDQLSAETSVDLGIDGDRAAQLKAHPAATYTVKTP
jgi:hypothetical protein